ncbi:hypothetical protein HY285_01650 [Candidatus Peregrinibacteria bacterium]|nr:hypothetical protein [Candidatus Peregrinibacteria bacterium]MBI3816232.1 hypothetical protein [Candidatus Peregrinibacteria bacterium]
MNLTLSWDLVAIVFFALIVTYTFIIGRSESVKIMLASYIAIIAVQALGNALQRFFGQGSIVADYVGFTVDSFLLSVTKLTLFIAIIIFLTVRAGFHVQYKKEPNQIVGMVITGLFGFATAGLLLSTLLTYISGLPLLDMKIATTASLSPIIKQSPLMEFMIVNQDLWFALPAVLLGVTGFLHNA